MIFGMESEILEFKKTTGELPAALKDIVAILNKNYGGELYFGIKNNGEVVGQTVTDSTLRDISQAIGTKVTPQIIPTIEAVKIDGKHCARVAFEGSKVPYFANGKAYIRMADESRQLSPEALESFFKKKQGQISTWDSASSGAELNDISENLVRAYMKRANKSGRLSYRFSTLSDTLKKLNLLERNELRNAALALFGSNPGLEIQMAVFATKERLTFLDIDRQKGTINQLVQMTEQYFRRNTRWRVVLDGTLQREGVLEDKEEMLIDQRDVGVNVGANVGVNVGVNFEAKLSKGLTSSQEAVIKLIQERPRTTTRDIADALGITTRQAERIRKDLKDLGLIRRVGSDKTGYWKVNVGQ